MSARSISIHGVGRRTALNQQVGNSGESTADAHEKDLISLVGPSDCVLVLDGPQL